MMPAQFTERLFMNRWWMSAWVVMVAGAMALGQATQPAESPKEVAAGHMRAIVTGDEVGLKVRVLAEGEDAQEILGAMVRICQAASRLKAALVERLGEEKTAEVYRSPRLPPPMALWESMRERIKEDVAEIVSPEGKTQAELHRVDGRWRLSLDEMARRMEAEQGTSVEEAIGYHRIMEKGFDRVAERVKRGELTTAEAVVEAMMGIFRVEGDVKGDEVDLEIRRRMQAEEAPTHTNMEVMRAILTGYEGQLRERVQAEGDEGRQLLAAMVEATQAAARLREAVTARWGLLAATGMYELPGMPDVSVMVGGLTESIEDDTTRLSSEGGSAFVLLHRVEGRWRVSLDETVRQQQAMGMSLEKILAGARYPVSRFDAVTQRIKQGEFETVEEVAEAMQKTIFRAEEEAK